MQFPQSIYLKQNETIINNTLFSNLGGFSWVLYWLNSNISCWTPTRVLANFLSESFTMVIWIHSRRSVASFSYSMISSWFSLMRSITWGAIKIYCKKNWFFKLPTSSHSMRGGGFTYIYTTTQVAVIVYSLTPKISLVILLTFCHIVLDVSFENLVLDQLIIP